MNSRSVGSPVFGTPLCPRTVPTVLASVFMPNRIDTFWMHQTSNSNFRVQDWPFLPFICDRPVIPGRTA